MAAVSRGTIEPPQHPPAAKSGAGSALRLLASLDRNQRETLTLAAAGHSYAEIQAIRGVTYTKVWRPGRPKGHCWMARRGHPCRAS